MAKKVKLEDIAEKVGVSIVTVSKALKDQKGVSAAKREEIKQVAAELGYEFKSVNSPASTKDTYNIGVLIHEDYIDKYDSFYWQIYQKLTTKANEKDCFTLLEIVKYEDELNQRLPKLLSENKVDALVVIGSMSYEYLNNLEKNIQLPLVCLDFTYDGSKVDSIISDSFYGGYALTKYLLDKGHREIAYVGTVLATSSITDRYLGYVKALMENNIEIRPDWVIKDRKLVNGIVDPKNYIELPKQMPTAFVCNCDLTASELIKKLERQGYKVPADISVVGYDNYLYPGLSKIGITSYEVDIENMTRLAVKRILLRLVNPDLQAKTLIVEGELIEKESVGVFPN